MPEQTQKLIHFTDNVLKAASRESEELNRQLENQRNAVLDEAKKTAWENAKAYYNREAAKLRAEAGREVSKHLMEGKRQVYLRRSQVAQEVLAQVRQRVDEFVASPAYSEHLKTLLARAMERLDGVDEIYLRLRPEDLGKMGVVMKRAQYFLTASGKRAEGLHFTQESLLGNLIAAEAPQLPQPEAEQLSLFQPAYS